MTVRFTRRIVLAGMATTALITMVACSSAPEAASTPASATSQATAAATSVAEATSTASQTPASATPASTASVKKVNANTASRAEIQATLAAAGVPNAAQWARAVEEYRPYPADDPSWAKLRKELAKYNPAAGVVDQIVAVLTP